MNDRRTEIAPAPRSAGVLVAQAFVPVHASQLPAPRVVTTHRTGENRSCAMCRHDKQPRLSNTLPPTPSVTDGHGVLTIQTSAPIGLTNPRTLIHTASFAEEDQ